MKHLLLAAKFAAFQKSSTIIESRQIRTALKRVLIKDREALKAIKSFKGIQTKLDPIEFARETTFSADELAIAISQPKSKFSHSVKDFIKHMQHAGFNLGSIISQKEIETKSFNQRFLDVTKLATEISDKLLGQDMAIEAISDYLISTSYSTTKGQPKGVFLFLGAPGTGKTYLSELMSEYMDEYDNIEVFDMANYQNNNDTGDLIGSSDTYKSSRPGRLTSSVARNPRAIIVFDEFEKANTHVQNLLLPLFSKGKLQDLFGKSGIQNSDNSVDEYKDLLPFYDEKGKLEVDFSQSIIIITTNLGSELYSNPSFLDRIQTNPISAKASIIETISREKRGDGSPAISAPIVSRLSQASIVMFNKLKFKDLSQLAENYINDSLQDFEEGTSCKVVFNNQRSVSDMLLLSLGPNFDTRNVKGSIPKILPFDLMTDELKKHYQNGGSEITAINLNISDKAKSQVEKVISSRKNITREMFRKNKTLSYTKSVVISDDVLTINFDSVETAKITRAADIGEADGILFNLPTETFEMIAGHGKVKARLKETVSLLKNPKTMLKFGVSLPKGVLLYGEPGTGKTMLAKALANAANLPFVGTTGNDLIDMGTDGIHNLFNKARDYAPCIIFIDEIDGIPKRGTAGAFGDSIVNRLLTEIDGFQSATDEPIFIVAATNRKDMLDDALIRSGRIEYHIEVPHLDRDARGFFVDKMLNHSAFQLIDVSRDKLIQLSTGMNGSQLEQVKRECILEIIKKETEQVTNEGLVEQINFIKYGHKLDLDTSTLRLEETAAHEAGHLVAQWYLSPKTKIEQITIMARANFLGMVSYEHGDNPEYSKEWLMGQTCVALAGREAQIKMHGLSSLDAGAESDLNAAMHYASSAISRLGMTEELYSISAIELKDLTGVEYFSNDIESAIKDWISEATETTRNLLNKHWNEVQEITKEVLEREVLYSDEIELILGSRVK